MASFPPARYHAFAAGLGQQVPEALRCLEAGFAAATQLLRVAQGALGPYPFHRWTRVAPVVAANNKQVLYAATEWGGLNKSIDGGVTWGRLNGHLPVVT